MDIILSVVIGLLSSLLASVVFLSFLNSMKPKVLIAPSIAMRKKENKFDYSIKIINRTRVPILNVRIRLELIDLHNVPGGKLFQEGTLSQYDVFQIERFDKKDVDASYAFRFRISDSIIHDKWTVDNSHLKLTLLATHSTSGFTKVFEQKYFYKETDLVNGTYEFGNSLDVVHQNDQDQ